MHDIVCSKNDFNSYGVSFMSVGGVEAEISMPQNIEKNVKVHLGNIDICAPTDVKLAPKYLFSQVLCYDIEFYLRRDAEKKI